MYKQNNQINNSAIILKQSCSQEVQAIICKTFIICDAIVQPMNIALDMRFEYGDRVLTIGTMSNNYWNGVCTLYDRNTVFFIKNSNEIKEFRLFRVAFDDYLQITLNGHTIYVGPDGGDYIEVINKERAYLGETIKTKVVFNGINEQPCERGNSWERDVNIDLKPYLKEGENTLNTRVIVSGSGEGWLQINVYKQCCLSEEITISGEICDSY